MTFDLAWTKAPWRNLARRVRRICPPSGAALVFLVSATLSFSGCSYFRPTLHAKLVKRVLDPNRRIEVNTMWAGAQPLTVRLRRPLSPVDEHYVIVRAVHDGVRLSLYAWWPDSTDPGERRLWIWSNPSQSYFQREVSTDSLALKFCIQGSPKACMMSGEDGIFDVWHWRSGWNHLFHFANDRKLTISTTPIDDPNAKVFSGFVRGSNVYLLWEEDEGNPPYAPVPRPRFHGRSSHFAIKATTPSGSQGDILAEAVYNDITQSWFIELARFLQTGHDDDYQFVGRGPHAFSLAITNDNDGQEHFTSDLIYLYLDQLD